MLQAHIEAMVGLKIKVGWKLTHQVDPDVLVVMQAELDDMRARVPAIENSYNNLANAVRSSPTGSQARNLEAWKTKLFLRGNARVTEIVHVILKIETITLNTRSPKTATCASILMRKWEGKVSSL